MKTLFKSIFSIIICSIALSNSAVAQPLFATQPQGNKPCEVGDFNAVYVSGKMEVTLLPGDCGVTLHADQALISYIQVSVRDSTLCIDYNEKAVPNDVKKIYRGRNAPTPILRASVSIPSLNGITATQNAIINGEGTISAGNIDLILTDKSIVKDLKLEAESAKLRMTKNSQADFNLLVESQLELSLDGASQLKLRYKARNMLLHQTGSATAIMDGESSTATCAIGSMAKSRMNHNGNVLVLDAGGSADITLSGEMGDLTLGVDRTARVDALEMNAKRVKADLNGWNHAYVHAEEFLGVNLNGGSALYYSGVPAIQVGKIVKSTFAPYEEPEKK